MLGCSVLMPTWATSRSLRYHGNMTLPEQLPVRRLWYAVLKISFSCQQRMGCRVMTTVELCRRGMSLLQWVCMIACSYGKQSHILGLYRLLNHPRTLNNLRQNAYPCVNVVGQGKTVGKAQVVLTSGRIHEEALTGGQRYTFLERQTLYVLSK